MGLHYTDWLVIGSFMALSLWIGLRYKNQASTGLAAYFLGGRNLPWYIAGTSMVATTFAADTPLAVTELVGQSGIAGNWLWWNFLLGGMLTTFFFARLWRRAGILTDVELIEIRYSGRAAAFLRMFRALYLGLFMNCLIIGWVNVALMSILEVFFGISREEQLLFVGLAMVIVMIYSSMSGLLGVAITDVVQFVIAMTGCVILAVLVVNSDKIGGISGLKAQLPAWSLDFFPQITKDSSVSNIAGTLTLSFGAFLAYTSVQWWASWYPGAEPGGGGYIAQRMMSAKDEKHALYATLFFQIAHYCIRPWPWILVGLCA
ncbi:MAG: sodium:proline symporter, partial [Sphingobacteriales bacterium]